jgi:hypothetical protein
LISRLTSENLRRIEKNIYKVGEVVDMGIEKEKKKRDLYWLP